MAKRTAPVDLTDSFEKIPIKILPDLREGSIFVARMVSDLIREKQKKKEREKEEYVQSIKTILAEAHKLETITNDLFKLANTSFKEEISLNDKVNLSDLIIEIISVFSENVKYNYKENTDDCYVLGNMELIKIAISNIFDNCIKFSENPEIDIEINRINKKLVVVIKDNGVGIPDFICKIPTNIH